jgi:hypothetical protein
MGYDFGEIEVDTSSDICLKPDTSWDGIVVSLPTSGYDYSFLAMTETAVDRGSRVITGARIYIRPDSITKERVMEHEFGHALGWQHYPQKYHMMHPEHDLGGYDTKGLRK